MRFPLHLRFKIAAIASQIYATDADEKPIFYVKQKLFKLKENIEIFADDSKTEKIYDVKADRIIDFSPLFTLYDAQGVAVGSVKRNGARSIWKASYDIKIGDATFTVQEVNPWVKMADAMLSQIPGLGLLSGYIFSPKYAITNQSTNQIGELDKLPAFFEGKYSLQSEAMANADDATKRHFAALMMVVVLRERLRG